MIAIVRADRARHRVAVAVTPGAPIFELAVPCEVFGIVRDELVDPWYDFQLCSSRPDTVVAGGFVAAEAGTMADLARADTVIVPACADVAQDPPASLLEALRAAHDQGARIAGICSGAFALAAAGLLDGRRAATHWMHTDELAHRYPRVRVDPKVLYVEDRGVFTSAGTAAGIDLCLELVRQDHGSTVANALARRLVVAPHRDGGQAQYVELPVPAHEDDALTPLLDWARARLHRPLTLHDLAVQGRLSRRTLVRRFQRTVGMPPLRWLRRERIRHAQQLLETTDLTVQAIAGRSGFGSSSNLRRHFVSQVGVTPHDYRRAFHSTGHGGDQRPQRAQADVLGQAVSGAASSIR